MNEGFNRKNNYNWKFEWKKQLELVVLMGKFAMNGVSVGN